MNFNLERFVDVAEHLISYSNKEEYQRSAVGRYYYAAYLKTREIYNKKMNKPGGTRISHKNLISSYENSNNEIERRIGENLRELRDNRYNADYDEEFVFRNLSKSKSVSEEVF